MTASEIAGVFARVGNLTFGGGAATTAALQREMLVRRKWLDEGAYALCYVLSRITPGTNLFAFCTAAGWLMRRWTGALTALLAASVPCCLVVWLTTAGFDAIRENSSIQAAVAGAMAASVGILLGSFWSLVRPHLTRRKWPRSMTIVCASGVLSLAAGMPPLAVFAVAAAAGLVWKEPVEE